MHILGPPEGGWIVILRSDLVRVEFCDIPEVDFRNWLPDPSRLELDFQWLSAHELPVSLRWFDLVLKQPDGRKSRLVDVLVSSVLFEEDGRLWEREPRSADALAAMLSRVSLRTILGLGDACTVDVGLA